MPQEATKKVFLLSYHRPKLPAGHTKRKSCCLDLQVRYAIQKLQILCSIRFFYFEVVNLQHIPRTLQNTCSFFFSSLRNLLSFHSTKLSCAMTIFVESEITYRKVASSRPVYYSILELFGQMSQYKSIKFPLHKPSENQKMCY